MTAGDVRPRHRPARVVLAWLGANLLLGYLWILPLGTAHTFTYYVRAVRWNTVVAPYGRDGATANVIFIVVATTALVTASILINRRHLRRLLAARPPGPPTAVAVVATAVVQILPFAVFMLATDRTFPPLLGWL